MERTDLSLPNHPSVELVQEAVAPERPSFPNRGWGGGLMATGLVLALIGVFLVKAVQERRA